MSARKEQIEFSGESDDFSVESEIGSEEEFGSTEELEGGLEEDLDAFTSGLYSVLDVSDGYGPSPLKILSNAEKIIALSK